MNKDLKIEMENFSIRVLKGGKDVHPQEMAIFPEVLKILIDLPDRGENVLPE